MDLPYCAEHETIGTQENVDPGERLRRVWRRSPPRSPGPTQPLIRLSSGSAAKPAQFSEF